MTSPSPTARRRSTPVPRRLHRRLAAGAAATALVVAWTPPLAWLWIPFRLLATTVHELAHGLAALLTGGRFLRFVIYPDGSGLAYTVGGWRPVVVMAGYLGVAVFAAALILTSGGRRSSRWALGTVGVALGLLCLRYGVPTLLAGEVAAGVLTLGVGLLLSIALATVAATAGDAAVVFAVQLLAFACAGTALADLATLAGLPGHTASDARTMAELLLLPPLVWALFWAAAAAWLLYLAFRRAWSR